jgi:hypothetical protein
MLYLSSEMLYVFIRIFYFPLEDRRQTQNVIIAPLCLHACNGYIVLTVRNIVRLCHKLMFVYFIFQNVNENSLKQLSSYIETLQQNRPTRPTTVTFYLRNQNTLDTGNYNCLEVRRTDIIKCTHACKCTYAHTFFCMSYVPPDAISGMFLLDM